MEYESKIKPRNNVKNHISNQWPGYMMKSHQHVRSEHHREVPMKKLHTNQMIGCSLDFPLNTGKHQTYLKGSFSIFTKDRVLPLPEDKAAGLGTRTQRHFQVLSTPYSEKVKIFNSYQKHGIRLSERERMHQRRHD